MIRVAVGRDLSFNGVSAREILMRAPEALTVTEGCGAEEILERARQDALEVALVSLDMSGVGALEVVRRAARFRGLGVLLVTAHARRSYPGSLLRLGALGHLTRGGQPRHVIEAVLAASRGERYIAPDIANRLSQSLIDERQRSPFETLTLRQLQVAVLLAQGWGAGEISRRLHLHAKTVNNHRRQVHALLAVATDAAIARLAMEHGLLSPPSSAPQAS